MKKDLLTLADLQREEIVSLIELAEKIKKNHLNYAQKLSGKTLMMIFEKPSLRTRVSFEAGMTQMGGHAIYYDLSTSPMGKKESVADTAKTASRYVDIVMARLFSHQQIIELAENSTVPVINALTDYSHPCQILADLLTIKEKFAKKKNLDKIENWKTLKLAYLGDGNNNVTHSLLFGCALMGIEIAVGCPPGEEYEPKKEVMEKAKLFAEKSGGRVSITNDAEEAIRGADIVYTDSWMSYHIPAEKKEERVKMFLPYQVNQKLMNLTKKEAIFMNCLPAQRGMEQTAEVIDGPQSIVFDQAENRLHIQKALLLKLLKVE